MEKNLVIVNRFCQSLVSSLYRGSTVINNIVSNIYLHYERAIRALDLAMTVMRLLTPKRDVVLTKERCTLHFHLETQKQTGITNKSKCVLMRIMSRIFSIPLK